MSGIAPIKAEYLIGNTLRPIPDDDVAESSGRNGIGAPNAVASFDGETQGTVENDNGSKRRKWSKEEKKMRQGSNKGRRFGKVRDELELCWKVANGQTCEFGQECRNTHDVNAYLSQKPRDITFPSGDLFSNTSPFINGIPSEGTPESGSVDYTTQCPVFHETGACRYGLRCRFLGGHVKTQEVTEPLQAEGGATGTEYELLKDDEKIAQRKIETTEMNYLGVPTINLLRKKKYPHPITDAYIKELQQQEGSNQHSATDALGGDNENIETVESQKDTPDVPLRFNEKKRLHWEGKTYLAPLTTVGNLPFRRLCVSLGADITCGEMGLATSFLQGSKEEWSLVRRHPSESIFGIQLAGSKPAPLTSVAEIIGREFSGGVDFVDLNCGCPIDLVFRSGSGSALLDTPGKLGKILAGMNKALGDIPLTVKLRTGVRDGKNTAHKLMPRLGAEWQIGAMTLHGRTRQQRYSKLADWDYIKQCVDAVRAREADEDLPRVPIFGGGDSYSSESYWSCVEQSGVDGVMIGRGALIKPWIFTEVKERREWDISSRERLELIRKYAEYGLNHFGSDTAGVNTTRRYLCEALSFHHRYVPIGLLEVLPGRLNDRPPAFRGRDELETLLASPDSRDWVKISELFLGPPPEGWIFTPKHKSNAYGAEEGQG